MSPVRLGLVAAMAGLALSGGIAHADEPMAEPMTLGPQPVPLLDSGRLLLTGGVTNIEGASGGGLATWATIAGYGSNEGVGADAHGTYVGLRDFSLADYGVSVGIFNRVELSYARQQFDTGSAGKRLGLGSGFTFDQDVYGAKVRLVGDLVYDQDTLLPQIAAGVQYKVNDKGPVIRAVGGRGSSGADVYVAATKLFLQYNLLVDATVRFTKANQTGLLGFGGDRRNGYQPQFEGSAAYLVSKHLAVGAEYRTKSDNLGFAQEDDWYDVFGAYALNKHLSATVAYANLGDIATFRRQDGVYVSLQAGF